MSCTTDTWWRDMLLCPVTSPVVAASNSAYLRILRCSLHARSSSSTSSINKSWSRNCRYEFLFLVEYRDGNVYTRLQLVSFTADTARPTVSSVQDLRHSTSYTRCIQSQSALTSLTVSFWVHVSLILTTASSVTSKQAFNIVVKYLNSVY